MKPRFNIYATRADSGERFLAFTWTRYPAGDGLDRCERNAAEFGIVLSSCDAMSLQEIKPGEFVEVSCVESRRFTI